jgi:uncharacterized membrane protein
MSDTSVWNDLDREGVVDQPQLLFTLWAIATGFCKSKLDFRYHFADQLDIDAIMTTLERLGLGQEVGDRLELTTAGRDLVGDVNLATGTPELVHEPLEGEDADVSLGSQVQPAESRLVAMLVESAIDANMLAQRIHDLIGEGKLLVRDAAIVARNSLGGISLAEQFDLASADALGSAFWGLLFSQLIAAPLTGAAMGGAVGVSSGSPEDIGIDADFIRRVGFDIAFGRSALFLVTSNQGLATTLHTIKDPRFSIIQSDLSIDQERRLRRALGPSIVSTGAIASPLTGAASGAVDWDERNNDAEDTQRNPPWRRDW